jgi:multimeric flavodoxin WrbA
MKILILNGNPSEKGKEIDGYIERLAGEIKNAGHSVQVFTLRDMKINSCVGCFNCWVKTPGLCSIKDDAREVARNYIAADHVIFCSPLIMGFVSSLLKNTMDRNLPLIHPHLEDLDGEIHHKKRYEKYPVISFLLEKETGTDDEDIAIATDIFGRQAINVRTKLGFVRLTQSPVEEVLHAIDIH